MKKSLLLSLLILLAPLFMANSPSPEFNPQEYTAYELTNESIIISEVESTKYITFSGDLQNTGNGIISLLESSIAYVFESNNYYIFTYYDEDSPIHGLVPNQMYSFEKKFTYTGDASLGTVTYSSRQIEIYGFQSEDIIQTIETSNQSVTSVNYSEEYDETRFTYSFDWTNSGELSAQTYFISFTMNDDDYVYYDWESINKNDEGHSDLNIIISGDCSTGELENINLFFIRRSYESSDWGSSLFQDLIVVGIIFTALVMLVPVIIITIVLVVVFKKKATKN